MAADAETARARCVWAFVFGIAACYAIAFGASGTRDAERGRCGADADADADAARVHRPPTAARARVHVH